MEAHVRCGQFPSGGDAPRVSIAELVVVVEATGERKEELFTQGHSIFADCAGTGRALPLIWISEGGGVAALAEALDFVLEGEYQFVVAVSSRELAAELIGQFFALALGCARARAIREILVFRIEKRSFEGMRPRMRIPTQCHPCVVLGDLRLAVAVHGHEVRKRGWVELGVGANVAISHVHPHSIEGREIRCQR